MRLTRFFALIGIVAFLGHTAWSNNSLSNLSSLSAPNNSATATRAATLLAQFSQQGSKLVGTGGVGINDYGNSVSLSADGNTAIIGAPHDNSGVGAAGVWTRSGAVWTQQGAKLVGSGAVGAAGQGYSASLSADGTCFKKRRGC